MFYQHFVDFMIWLFGVLHFIGWLGGFVFFVCLIAYGIHGKYDGRFFWWMDDYYNDNDDDYHGKRMA